MWPAFSDRDMFFFKSHINPQPRLNGLASPWLVSPPQELGLALGSRAFRSRASTTPWEESVRYNSSLSLVIFLRQEQILMGHLGFFSWRNLDTRVRSLRVLLSPPLTLP